MENNQPKVGAVVLTLSILQLVVSGLVILVYLGTFFLKDQIEGAGGPAISNITLIISMAITLIVALGIILILRRKKLGIYLYFIAVASNILYSIMNDGVKNSVFLTLIIPVLMGIYIWKKKEVFGIGTNAEDVSK